MKIGIAGTVNDDLLSYPEVPKPPPLRASLGVKVSPDQIKYAEVQLNAIELMLHNPGWQLYEQHLKQREQGLFEELIKATDPHILTRLSGEYKAIRETRLWPLNHRELLKKYIDQWSTPTAYRSEG